MFNAVLIAGTLQANGSHHSNDQGINSKGGASRAAAQRASLVANASWTAPVGLCVTSPSFPLNTLLDPGATPGGEWTVQGFVRTVFEAGEWVTDSLAGATVIVTYTVGTGPDQVSHTQNIVIEGLPDPCWEPPTVLCVNTQPFDPFIMLCPGIDPGGYWEVEGDPIPEFNPGLLGAGFHNVSYTLGDPPCENTLNILVEIEPLPQAGWTPPDTLCSLNGPIDLFDYLDAGTDDTGSWQLDDVPIPSVFDPADHPAGDYTLTYIVGFFPCDDRDSHQIHISGPANAAWTAPDPICQSGDTLILDDLLSPGATPGGRWRIDGQLDSILPLSSDTGAYLLTYEAGPAGCADALTDTVFLAAGPAAAFSLSADTICLDESVLLTVDAIPPASALVDWQLSGGTTDPLLPADTFEIRWPDTGRKALVLSITDNGCTAVQRDTVTVLPVPDAPVPECGPATTGSLVVTWPELNDTVDYRVQITGLDTLVTDTNFVSLTNLEPGQTYEFFVQALHPQGCPSEEPTALICSTLPCPDLTISFPAIDTVCLTPQTTPFTLSVSLSYSNGGSGEWSGPGITDASTGLFDPQEAGAGTHTIIYRYTYLNCSWQDSLQIVVAASPAASFYAPDSVCVHQPTTLTFTGTAGPTAVFQWDFDGAEVIDGSGAGPYTLQWQTPGVKSISLTIIENSCQSAIFTQTVNVSAAPIPPTLHCWESPDAVEFFWDDPPSGDPELQQLAGPAGVFSSDTSFLVSGLDLDEAATIALTMDGTGGCADTTVTATCTAGPCPEIIIDFADYPVFCLPDAPAVLPLGVTLSNNQGDGLHQWSGPGIVDPANGLFSAAAAGNGDHQILFTYTEGLCEYTDTLPLQVYTRPDPSFIAPDTICLGDGAVVTYTGNAGPAAIFNWDFGEAEVVAGQTQGPYTLQWPAAGTYPVALTVSENGCASAAEEALIFVEAPLDTPQISCSANFSSVEFFWNPAPGLTYTGGTLEGPPGVFNTNQSYRIENLMPDQPVVFELTASGAGPCPDVIAIDSCSTLPCPDVTVAIDPVAPVCWSGAPDTLQLTYQLNGGSALGALTWSGPGIIDPANGRWRSDDSIVGSAVPIVLTYAEDVCIYTDTLYLNVLDQPEAGFVLSSPLCVEDTVQITFDGVAPPGADYIWDFDGGIAEPGFGPGPHWVFWPAAGVKNLSLIVDAGDCAADTATQELLLETILLLPTIDCQATVTELSFHWNEYPSAAGYEVNVLNGPAGSFIETTSYLIQGLQPEQEVQFEVTVLSNNTCPPVTVQQSCSTLPCPERQLEIAEIPPICAATAPEVIDLSFTIDGAEGTGQQTWSGPGIINAGQGLWQRSMDMSEQTIPITLTYSEGPCVYRDTLFIEIPPPPTVDFTAETPICETDTSQLTIISDLPQSASLLWHFGEGATVGPDEDWVFWNAPGSYTVALQVLVDNCPSDTVRRTVVVHPELAPPVISCSAEDSLLSLAWTPVDGAVGYELIHLEGSEGQFAGDFLYQVDGLSPGDSVTVEVVAYSGNDCPAVSSVVTCGTPLCPDLSIAIDSLPDICLDADADTLLNPGYTLTGDDGSGLVTWSGEGLLDAQAGIWSIAAGLSEGEIPIFVTYTEGICIARDTALLRVQARPTADFVLPDSICLGDTVDLSYAGNASPTAIFDWDFGGGEVDPGAAPGPYRITWNTAGAFPVSLTVSANGCVSEPVSRLIEVGAPLPLPEVECTTGYDSVTFSWTPAPAAAGYEVTLINGAGGQMTGANRYSVSGLLPEQEVMINLTALSPNSCPSPVVQAGCTTLACPEIDVRLTADTVICAGDSVGVTIGFSGNIDGPFDLTLVVADQPYLLSGLVSDTTLYFQPDGNTEVVISQAAWPAAPECSLNLPAPLTIVVLDAFSSGQPLPDLSICRGEERLITLADRLEGESGGGRWTDISTSPAGAGFDETAGALATAMLLPGAYRFEYAPPAGASCGPESSVVNIVVNERPVADAGPPGALTCSDTALVLGGPLTSTGPGLRYTWVSLTGSGPAMPAALNPVVTQPGLYRLRVEDIHSTCFDTSSVRISSEQYMLLPFLSVEPVLCHGDANGLIRVDTVEGGVGPYTYRLTGYPAQTTPVFSRLDDGVYQLEVRDANGCTGAETVFLDDPPPLSFQLTAQLGSDTLRVPQGSQVDLEVLADFPIDSIYWMPEELNEQESPTRKRYLVEKNVQISALAFDENGCLVFDALPLLVGISPQIYVPNVFSPNNDGVNDGFTLFTNHEVEEIENLRVFSRWGELVFERESFQPNDESLGWNGIFRGQPMGVGVFTYTAKVRLIDDSTRILGGDVLLLPR